MPSTAEVAVVESFEEPSNEASRISEWIRVAAFRRLHGTGRRSVAAGGSGRVPLRGPDARSEQRFDLLAHRRNVPADEGGRWCDRQGLLLRLEQLLGQRTWRDQFRRAGAFPARPLGGRADSP